MTNHPIREITYWSAADDRHHTIRCTDIRSMAGRVRGPEYRVSYHCPDGQWINGIRHTDRGDLMTDIHVSARPSVR